MSMVLRAEDIEDTLRSHLNDVRSVAATDLKGGNHWQVDIVASDFNGLSRIKQQQLVYAALADYLADETIHALVIKAKGTEG